MFRRVLVPVDFTPRSLRAARTAARLAAANRADVLLLHVIERIDDLDSPSLDSFYRKLEGAARGRMKTFADVFRKRGVAVEAAVLYGKPVNEILRCARDNRSDLIVLSSHKIPLRHGESWGTVSYKVGILSRCPVLLVK